MNTRTTPSVVTDDGLVERMAKAMHERQRASVLGALGKDDVRAAQRPPWDQESEGIRRVYLDLAHAALAASDRDVLVDALREAREAIASLDEDALGAVRVHPSGDLDNGYAYPIRDELLAKIDAALIPLAGEL